MLNACNLLACFVTFAKYCNDIAWLCKGDSAFNCCLAINNDFARMRDSINHLLQNYIWVFATWIIAC